MCKIFTLAGIRDVAIGENTRIVDAEGKRNADSTSEMARNTKTPVSDRESGNGSVSVDGIPAEAGNENRVDRIRDLLFGEQMDDYESRFRALEQDLESRMSTLEAMVRDQVDELRNEFGKKADQLDAKADKIEDTAVKREHLATKLEGLAKALRDASRK